MGLIVDLHNWAPFVFGFVSCLFCFSFETFLSTSLAIVILALTNTSNVEKRNVTSGYQARAYLARVMDVNHLSRQRQPFTLSNDRRKVWATVLFPSAIMHR